MMIEVLEPKRNQILRTSISRSRTNKGERGGGEGRANVLQVEGIRLLITRPREYGTLFFLEGFPITANRSFLHCQTWLKSKVLTLSDGRGGGGGGYNENVCLSILTIGFAFLQYREGACRVFPRQVAFHKGDTSHYSNHRLCGSTPIGFCHQVLYSLWCFRLLLMGSNVGVRKLRFVGS